MLGSRNTAGRDVYRQVMKITLQTVLDSVGADIKEKLAFPDPNRFEELDQYSLNDLLLDIGLLFPFQISTKLMDTPPV